MKIGRNRQIPNMAVYGVLYAIIFGVSIWLLTFHNESSMNWILYVAMSVAVLAGLVKFAIHSLQRRQSA